MVVMYTKLFELQKLMKYFNEVRNPEDSYAVSIMKDNHHWECSMWGNHVWHGISLNTMEVSCDNGG